MKTIPLVDLGDIEPTTDFAKNPAWIAAADKIRDGLGSVGFLYVVNHGISESVISEVMTQSKDFFNLPEAIKMKYKKDNTPSPGKPFDLDKHCGYTPLGEEILEKDIQMEVKEIFDWLDKGRNFNPKDELPNMESAIDALTRECHKFLKTFFRLLAMGLQVEDPDVFVKACSNFDDPDKKGMDVFRILHYPPIPEEIEPNPGTVRCGVHSDYLFLTILFQDDVGGLEVKTVDGNWVQATPVPGSILINTGDLTEFWTCGIFPATPHKVTIPDKSDTRHSQSRYSIAFFNGPDVDAVITPIDMEKRPCEQERLASNGKVYSKKPVVAFDHFTHKIVETRGYL